MSRKLTNVAQGNKFKDEVESLNLLKAGVNSVFFTNWDNDLEPQILEDSFLEVNGTIYHWKNTISIEGDLIGHSGIVFIRTDITVADDEYLSLVFDASLLRNDVSYQMIKKGYYDLSGNRVVAYFNYDSGVFTDKRYF